MELNPGKLSLAKHELDVLRSRGLRVSTPEPIVLVRSATTSAPVRVAWATDRLFIPTLADNCVCNLMVALLGMSAAGLGVARDPLFVHPPKAEDGGVTWVMVEAAIQRARARQQAFGALALPREVVPGGLHAMLQLSEGVYAFTGYLLRNSVWHRHAVGFNAGASLFYLNPWVVVVEPLDRLFPATFFAKLRLQYGLLLPPQTTLRRLALDVTVPCCSVLPYVVPALLTPPAPTHARKRNARDKQKQRPRKRRRTDV